MSASPSLPCLNTGPDPAGKPGYGIPCGHVQCCPAPSSATPNAWAWLEVSCVHGARGASGTRHATTCRHRGQWTGHPSRFRGTSECPGQDPMTTMGDSGIPILVTARKRGSEVPCPANWQGNRILTGAWHLGTRRSCEKPKLAPGTGNIHPRRHRGQAHRDLWMYGSTAVVVAWRPFPVGNLHPVPINPDAPLIAPDFGHSPLLSP